MDSHCIPFIPLWNVFETSGSEVKQQQPIKPVPEHAPSGVRLNRNIIQGGMKQERTSE